MFLKALEIQGFKSFPDKTILNFDDGITAVVGPNGSGKSNIGDAMRWVLGEQSAKVLRGGKMEDVIFSGTQIRKAVGYASVKIIFDNSEGFFDIDADEVSLHRKFYRSGESEYKINGNSVLMRDVQELLMDTGIGRDGYAMIGQGKISEIVSAKNTDRRQIFEEAAGISKYRYRREQTERRLSKAEENLIRLKDIVLELEDRLAPLKKQSEKAEEFLKLSNRKRGLEVSLMLLNLEKSKLDLRSVRNKIMVCQTDYDALDEKLAKIEEKNKNIYEQMNKCSLDVEGFRKDISKKEEEISSLESSKAVSKNEISHKKEGIESFEKEILSLSKSSEELLSEQNISRKKYENLCEEIEGLEKEISQAEGILVDVLDASTEKIKNIDTISEDFRISNDKLSYTLIQINKFETKIEEILNRKSEISKTLVSWDSEKEKLLKEKIDVENFINLLDEKLNDSKTLSDKMRADIEIRKIENKNLHDEEMSLTLKSREIANKVDMLSNMEKNMEDFPYSVKTIMSLKKDGKLFGIEGTVASLIEVSKEYTVALETALGYNMQNIVVSDEEVAKKSISILKEKKAGRATFLPLTSVEGRQADITKIKDIDGFIGVASELLKYDDKYSGVISFLLGRTLVCTDLDTGSEIAKVLKYKFKIVTLDGQVINAGGSYTGGSNSKNTGILSRRNEMSELESQNEIIKNKLKENKEKSEILSKELKENERQIIIYNENEKKLVDDSLKAKYELESLAKQILDNENYRLRAEKEKKESEQRIADIKISLEKEYEEKNILEDKILKLTSQIETINMSKEEFLEKKDEINLDIREKKMKLLEKKKDSELLKFSIDETSRRHEISSKRTEEIKQNIKTLESDIINLNIDIEEAEKKKIECRNEIINFHEDIKSCLKKREELEKSTSDSRQSEREIMQEKENVRGEQTRLDEMRKSFEIASDEIVARLWDEYELTVSAANEEAISLEDTNKSKIELQSLKTRIKNLGTVNVGAIEEYKEVNERYEFLTSQCLDVENSKNELIKLVGDLTNTMEEMFASCFEEINGHFKVIFRDLFGGGKANLSLTDKNNVLESGIEISVQPPGKVIKNLSSLSGGEQAFVAIAIYFAILKVRPAPFCLLDEIEAALDDINVTKYAQYLKTMSDKIQFIVVSHRRGTMEEADILYGVTMQEEGISKLLKLELAEAEKTILLEEK